MKQLIDKDELLGILEEDIESICENKYIINLINQLPVFDLDEKLNQIDKAIEKEHDMYKRTLNACTIMAEHMTPELVRRSFEAQRNIQLNYERISGLQEAKNILETCEAGK